MWEPDKTQCARRELEKKPITTEAREKLAKEETSFHSFGQLMDERGRSPSEDLSQNDAESVYITFCRAERPVDDLRSTPAIWRLEHLCGAADGARLQV